MMFGISMYVYVGHITSQEELEAIGSFFFVVGVWPGTPQSRPSERCRCSIIGKKDNVPFLGPWDGKAGCC